MSSFPGKHVRMATSQALGRGVFNETISAMLLLNINFNKYFYIACIAPFDVVNNLFYFQEYCLLVKISFLHYFKVTFRKLLIKIMDIYMMI